MKNSTNKFYQTPQCEVHYLESGAFMIEIGSGNTSPEESDTNSSFFEEEEEVNFNHTRNLWDD